MIEERTSQKISTMKKIFDGKKGEWNVVIVLGTIVFSFFLSLGIQALTNPIDFNLAIMEETLSDVEITAEYVDNGKTVTDLICVGQANVLYVEIKEAINGAMTVEIYQDEDENKLLLSSNFAMGEQAKRFYLKGETGDSFRIVITSENADVEVEQILSGGVSKIDLEMTKISIADTAIQMMVIFALTIFIYLKKEKIGAMIFRIESLINRKNEEILNKYIILVMVIVFASMVVFGLNISHMEQYNMVIGGNISSLDPVMLGESRGIRSDEWLGINTLFHNMTEENMGLTNWQEMIAFYVQPQNWGFAFLPNVNAFAFYTLMPYLIAGIAVYLFVDILLPKKKWISLVSTFIICFAPENLWWWGPETVGSSIAIVVAFYYFFVSVRIRGKIICSVVLACLLPTYVISVYPAWDVPMVYVSIVLVLVLFIKNKKVKFARTDLIYIASVIAWSLIVYLCHYFSQRENLEAIMKTVYPGKRESVGGDLSVEYLFHYLMMPITPHQDVAMLNNSENSAYLALYPLPFIIFLFDFKNMMKNKIIITLQVMTSILFIYIFLGMPLWLTKISGFSYSIGARTFTIYGLACVILLILQADHMKKIEAGKYLAIKSKIILFNICIMGFFVFGYVNSEYVFEELGIIASFIMLLLVFLFGNLLFFGYKKTYFFFWSVFALICSLNMIPINYGIGIMQDTSIAQEIRAIDECEEGNWMTLDDWIMSKYVNSQGVECLNVLSYPPRFDLFYPLDQERLYEEIYNRYAHITVKLTDNESSNFELGHMDQVTVNLSEQDIDLWNVKYIVSKSEINIDTIELYTDLIHYDQQDGYHIYKVSYK